MPPLTFTGHLELLRRSQQARRYDLPLSPDAAANTLAADASLNGPGSGLSQSQEACVVVGLYNNKMYRDHIIAALAMAYPEQALVLASKSLDLLQEVRQAGQYSRLVHVLDTDTWFDDGEGLAMLQQLNQGLAAISGALVIWLSEDDSEDFISLAPELWEQCQAEIDFCNFAQDAPAHPIYAQFIDEQDETDADRPQRLVAISHYLASKSIYSLADSFLCLEQARILAHAGGLDAALAAARRCVAMRLPSQDPQATVLAWVELAGVLQKQGAWDEALQILRNEILPLYRVLGDKRAIAVTQGKIADALQAQGALAEALHIARNEVLPVFAALGDRRGLLVAQTKLALLLEGLGSQRHLPEIRTLLAQALQSAEHLAIPEQAIIKTFLDEFTV